MGYLAGATLNSGTGNVAIGREALELQNTASGNTAVGKQALEANTGAGHVAVGSEALRGNTTGTDNVAVGAGALTANTTGTVNTAVGKSALKANTTASHNTALGEGAGEACTTGFANTFIGRAAGNSTTTGDYIITIGYATDASSATADNQIVMGDSVTGNAANSFCFGSGSTDSAITFGATSITAPSDIRLKEDIQDEKVGLDFINELRPVTFQWKKAKDVPAEMKAHSDSEERVMNGKYNHGFIAQEVKEVIDNNPDIKDGFDIWSEDERDGRQRIGESALIPMLVKSIQELSAEVEELKQQLNQEE
jgi:hypothetical protein